MRPVIAVIGAGMAGASAAAELARCNDVVLLERETQPGYHSTGRSAALFSETYGAAPVRALSRASRNFLFNPPEGFCDGSLVQRRGSLFIAREDQLADLDELEASIETREAIVRVCPREARRINPLLREEYIAGAIHEPGSADVEVHELHQGYLRLFKRRGGKLLLNSPVERIRRDGAAWNLSLSDANFYADYIVNAAGAWADRVALLAGTVPLSVQPLRRTAILVSPPDGVDISGLPLTIDVAEEFYAKPDAGNLLLSPADETPVEPCDAFPEEWDIAVAVDRVCTAMDLDVQRVTHSWAGLRSFAPDRIPVAGFDANIPGFFWLAGQGGYGIQTAPAMARLTAALFADDGVPEDLKAAGVDPAELAPDRFGQPATRPLAVAK